MPNDPSNRPRLRDFLRFGKPKTPGFGISRDFYLSVLSPSPVLPSLEEWVNPKGLNNAIPGYGAPLGEKKSKDDLRVPLSRGVYAIASLDRRTVIRAMVMPPDEAGFDPNVLVRHLERLGLNEESLSRVRASWNLVQMSFESHDPMVTPAVVFFLALAKRLAILVGGMVADPLAEKYRMPDEVLRPGVLGLPFHIRDVMSPHFKPRDSGSVYVYTRGMQKFGLPEWELDNVPEQFAAVAANLLEVLSSMQLQKTDFQLGDGVGSRDAPLMIATGGLDRGMWEGISCFELIPDKGKTVEECLTAFEATLP